MLITNLTRGTTLATDAKMADTWLTRLVGLLNRDNLNAGEALILLPCRAVHTCFMRFGIDVLFISKHNRVVGMVENMVPYKFGKTYKEAYQVVELPVGSIEMTETEIGDEIKIM